MSDTMESNVLTEETMTEMTQIRKIRRKTLLYQSGVEYADYALNHVEGCTHGCRYPCYAMMLKKRCGVIHTYQDWTKPKIVENALELLEKELPRKKNKIKEVFLCFATDPFMYQQPDVEELTLKILEQLNRYSIKSVIISKGIYPKVLSDTSRFNPDNEYGSTLVSLNDDFQSKYEPFASPIKDRVKALKNLHDAGLRTWISMEPYPTPNLVKQDIQQILKEISFADKIVFGKWNYSKLTQAFRGYKDFYNVNAKEVIQFCKKNRIDFHIKDKTIDLTNTEIKSTEKKILSNYLRLTAVSDV